MDNVEILSPGKKIKAIRNSLGLKQHEITGGEITRNLISMIENDKGSLTPLVAEIIATNINKVCELKRIDFSVSSSYLIEDEKLQASRIADKYIKLLNESSNNTYSELSKDIEVTERFLAHNDIGEKKVVIYEKIGDILRERNEYYRSYTYYIKAFENAERLYNDLSLSKLLLKISQSCIYLKRYKEALDFNKLAFIYNDKMPYELEFSLLFNNILAYKKLELYDKALSEIEHIENHFKEIPSNDLFDLLTLKANCLKENKYYKDSLDQHKQLLSMIDSSDIIKQLVVICNILDIYVYLSDIKNAKKYVEKSISFISSIKDLSKDYYAPQIYKEIANASYFLGRMDIAIDFFQKSITTARQFKQNDILLSSLESLLSIYITENNDKELDALKNQLLEFILLEPDSKYHRIIYKFIDYYNNINDQESIKGLLSFILRVSTL